LLYEINFIEKNIVAFEEFWNLNLKFAKENVVV